MENFDYQFFNEDFVHDLLNSEILDFQVSVYVLKPCEYALRLQNPRLYKILNRDFLNQWVFPYSP